MVPLGVARLPLQMPSQTSAGCPSCVCQLRRLCLACLVGIIPLPLRCWNDLETRLVLDIEYMLYMLYHMLSLLLAGESEAKLRQLFQEATQVAPCIVFIGMPPFHSILHCLGSCL